MIKKLFQQDISRTALSKTEFINDFRPIHYYEDLQEDKSQKPYFELVGAVNDSEENNLLNAIFQKAQETVLGLFSNYFEQSGGFWETNDDGTFKLDAEGNYIPIDPLNNITIQKIRWAIYELADYIILVDNLKMIEAPSFSYGNGSQSFSANLSANAGGSEQLWALMPSSVKRYIIESNIYILIEGKNIKDIFIPSDYARKTDLDFKVNGLNNAIDLDENVFEKNTDNKITVKKQLAGYAVFADGKTKTSDVDIEKEDNGDVLLRAIGAIKKKSTLAYVFGVNGMFSPETGIATTLIVFGDDKDKDPYLDTLLQDGGKLKLFNTAIFDANETDFNVKNVVAKDGITLNGVKKTSWDTIPDLNNYYDKQEVDGKLETKADKEPYWWDKQSKFKSEIGATDSAGDTREDGVYISKGNIDKLVVKENEIFTTVPIRGAGNLNDPTTLVNVNQANQIAIAAQPTETKTTLHENTTLNEVVVKRDKFYSIGTTVATEAVIENSTAFNNMVTNGYLYDAKPDQNYYSFDILIGGEQLDTMLEQPLGTDLYARKNITVNKLQVGKELEIPEINIPLFDATDNIVANMTLKDIRIGISKDGMLNISESVLMRWATINTQGQENVKFDKTVFLNDDAITYDKQDIRVYLVEVVALDLAAGGTSPTEEVWEDITGIKTVKELTTKYKKLSTTYDRNGLIDYKEFPDVVEDTHPELPVFSTEYMGTGFGEPAIRIWNLRLANSTFNYKILSISTGNELDSGEYPFSVGKVKGVLR